MHKNNKKGELRVVVVVVVVVVVAVTSEEGVVNPVSSSSGSGDESVAKNFKKILYFLRITNFYQINLFLSFPGKQVPSLTLGPTYFRVPSRLF